LANIYNSAKGKVPSTSQPLNKKNGRTSGAEIKRKNRFFIQSLIRPFKKVCRTHRYDHISLLHFCPGEVLQELVARHAAKVDGLLRKTSAFF